MLTTLLPGVREARSALAAGYLYLASLYVYLRSALEGLLVHDADARAIAEGLRAVFGGVGIAVTLTFAALIVGSAATDLTRSTILRLGRIGRLSPRGFATLATVGDRLTEDVDRRPAVVQQRLMEGPPRASTIVSALEQELPLVRTRLLAEDPGLFGEVDRLEAEAEFRIAVGAALQTFILTATFRITPYAAFGLPLGFALTAFGFRRARDAADLLADVLLLKRVRAPLMDRVASEVERL